MVEDIRKSIFNLQDDVIKARTKGAKDVKSRKRKIAGFSYRPTGRRVTTLEKVGLESFVDSKGRVGLRSIKKAILDLQDSVIEKAQTQVKEYLRTRRGKQERVGAYSRSWAQVAKERKEQAKKEGKEVPVEAGGIESKGEDKFRVPAVPPLKGLKVGEYRELLKQGHTWREIKAFGTSDAARAKLKGGGEKKEIPTEAGGTKEPKEGEPRIVERGAKKKEEVSDPRGVIASAGSEKRKEEELEREGEWQEPSKEVKGKFSKERADIESRMKEGSQALGLKGGEKQKEAESKVKVPVEFRKTHKVGNTVEVGNKRMIITAVAEKGFQARDDEGNLKRVSWKSIEGYGTEDVVEEYEEPELTRKESKIMSKYNRKVLSQRMDEAYNNLDKIKAARKKLKTSGYSKEEVKELKQGLDDAQKQVNSYLNNLIATTPKMEIYKVSISKLMSKVAELIKVLVRRTNAKAVKGETSSAKYKEQAQGLLSKFVKWMKGLVGKGKFKFSEDQRAYVKLKLEEIGKEREARKPEAIAAKKQQFEEGRKKGMEKLKAAREEKKKKTEGWSKEKAAEIEEKRKAGYEKYKAGKKVAKEEEPKKVPELKEKGAPEANKIITKEEIQGLGKLGYNDEEIKKLGEQGAKAAYWNKISPEDSGVREKKMEEKKTTGKAKAEEIASKRKEGYTKWQAAKKKQKETVKKSLSWQDIAKQEQHVLVKKAVGGRTNVVEEKMLGNIARQRGEVYTTFEERLRPSERKMLRDIKANIIMLKPEWSRKRKGKLETVHRRKNTILRRPKQGKIPKA